MTQSPILTDQQWQQYERDGYLKLGPCLAGEEVEALRQRIDEIMLGKARIDYRRIRMQRDTDGENYARPGEFTPGFKGATLTYRKIQELEFDPLFLAYMQKPLFREICSHLYGKETPIAAYRAMFMNKPARKGTFLQWHQDRWSYLDRDPQVTMWTALDPATIANGCVQIIPGSHRRGVINPSDINGHLTDELAAQHAPKKDVVFLELQPGECVMMHNYLLHSSDVNKTDIPRRAFSVCYMEARTISTREGDAFTRIFGDGALCVKDLESAVAA